MARVGREGGRFDDVRSFVGELYGPGLHAKRIDSLAGATLGTMTAASLAVALIGQALAQARGLKTKHAIKQVDRLLSNEGINVWDSFARWVPHQIGDRQEHGHEHGEACGHTAVPHLDHVDYVHDGHRHAVHGGHYDEH